MGNTETVAVDAGSDNDDQFAEHQRRGALASIQHLLHKYPTISPAIVLIVSLLVFTAFGDGKFQAPYNLSIMLQQAAVLATLGVGQTLIVLTAGVDLAVGTGMVLTSIVMAKTSVDMGVPGFVALLIGAVVGLALGAFHGFLVARVKLPPFIVTLGTFFIFNSIALVYSKNETIDPGEGSLLTWTGKSIGIGEFRLTTGVMVAVALYVIVGMVLATTAWGKHVYATGDDAEAARLAGINTTRVLFSVYMVAGLIYAIGAWVQIGRVGSASTNAGTDVNLGTITAVVIGGTSLFGGRGRLSGTLIGALIVSIFQQGLRVADVDAYYQNLAIGSLILIAVGLDQWIRRVGD